MTVETVDITKSSKESRTNGEKRKVKGSIYASDNNYSSYSIKEISGKKPNVSIIIIHYLKIEKYISFHFLRTRTI
jgi:hypothetical protein